MEEILMSGATGILKKLVGVVSKDIGLALDVNDDLKKLQTTSEMILAVIADAERRQEKEELVRLWLRRLRDIAYDADDVIDEFCYEDMRRRDREDSLKHKVLNFTSSSNPSLIFRFKMAKKIKDINKRLNEITQDIDRFQLQVTAPIPDGESNEQLDRQVTSHVNESEIVGREYDESQIIKLLTTDPKSSSSSPPPVFDNPNHSLEKVYVISIVGMGGLGKSTLAQLVYKNEVVKKLFEPTMWVHVSEIFDIEILLVKIMESITQTKFHRVSNFCVLVNIVREHLDGKKYLLVLDDLWNDDSEQWECLKSVLLVGAPGSKILITTRNDRVASIVRGSIPPYNLSQLQDDACWSIIKQRAFSPGGALISPEMSDIGKEISKKCCGLPLAAKFLGSLMHLKKKGSDWISIRDDDIWSTPESKRKILPVLKLSYNNLSSQLKQCFSYCSIFPKNWEISKEILVHLWMAEGFVKQSNIKNKRSAEDIGRNYFESLAWSSFFHNFKKNELGDIETCKMHDLVHDLAEEVGGENELAALKASEFTDVSKVRRLRLELDEDISKTFLKKLSNAKKLRTIFAPEGSNVDPLIFSRNNNLRVLHAGLSPNFSFPKLSSLSLNLRHLRYLRLNSLDMRDVSNGQSIGKLYNLETLVFTNFYGVQNLLTNIHSLQKLRYLEVSWTVMEELPDSVTSLCNLQTLDLNNCELKVIPESICGLKNLTSLNLSFNPFEELPVSIITLSSLQTLDVNTCKNLKVLPEFVSDLSNLQIFDFRNCPLLKALPIDFGSLTQLRSLDLEGTEMTVLPEPCSNLENLEFVNLSLCESPKDVKNWEKVRKFYHNPLGNPTILGIGKLVCLEELYYMVPEKQPECNVGIQDLGNLNMLETLGIWGLQNVKDRMDAERANLKGKQNLLGLALFWDEIEEDPLQMTCNDLQVFEALQPPIGLVSLRIENFIGSELPTWMCVPSGFPSLDTLVLQNCKGIKQLPAAIGQLPRLLQLTLGGISLKRLDIGGFCSLIWLDLADMFLLEELCDPYPCLEILVINGCKSLSRIPWFPCLKQLQVENINLKLVSSICRSHTSLTKVLLNRIEELIFFPASILRHNCNLQELKIEECNQFQGFLVKDDENESPNFHTASLQRLVLLECPVLKFLPDLPRWTFLKGLTIFNCPYVKESLTYDLKSLTFLQYMWVDFIQRDEQRGDPSVYHDMINLMNK